MSQKRIKSLLFPGILLILLVCTCVLYADFLLQRPSVQRFLVKKVSEAAGYDVKVESFRIYLWRGLKITAHGLTATARNRKEHITASIARIGLDGKALLRGRFVPRSLDLDNPVISISFPRQKEGEKRSLEEILGNVGLLKLAAIRSLSITGGQVNIEGSPFSLQSLFLKVSRKETKTLDQVIHLKTALGFKGGHIPFYLQGHVRYGKKQERITVDLSGKTRRIPVSWVPWPRFAPFSGGLIDVDFHVAGPLGDSLSAGGTFQGRDLRFAITRRDRRKEYALPSMTLDFNARLEKGILKIHIPQAKLLDTSLSARIFFEPAKPSPRLELSIKSPFMSLRTFKTVFPSSLVPAWIEKGLFPRLSGGEVMADHFSLVGTLDQIAHLNRRENTSGLAMVVTWKNLHVLKQGSPLPFEEVAGQMEIKDNRLDLSRMQGRFGTSAVHEASLNVTSLVGGRHTYTITLDGDFAVQDLVEMRGLPWTPAEFKGRLAGLAGSSGRLRASLKALKKGSGIIPRIKSGSMTFKECTFVHEAFLFPVRVEKGEMEIEDTGRVRFKGSGSWGNSVLAVSGSAGRSMENLTTKVAGTLDLDALATRLFPGKTWSLHFGKPVGCTMHVSRKKTAWSFAGMIDLNEEPALKVGSLQLNPLCRKGGICFDVGYIPGKNLQIRSFDGRFGKSLFSASGVVTLSGEKRITAEVTIPGLFVKDLGVQFQGSCPVATGVVKGHVRGTFPVNDFLSSTLTGKLEGSELCLGLKGLPHPLISGGFTALFSGDKVSIKSLGFTIGKSSIEIQGNLRDWKALRGNLTIRSEKIDLADFLPRKKGQAQKKGSFFLQPLLNHSAGLGVSLRASRVTWRKMKMGPFRGDGVFEQGVFHLLNSRLKSKHGSITMKGDYRGEKNKKITFLSHIRLFEQPVQELFRNFKVRNYYLEGQLSTDILLSGEGHDKKSLAAGLRGKGKMLLEKGVIKKSNVLIKILDFLSIQKIFRRPPPNLSKEGFYFDKIGADFVIRKGVLSTENLMMRSPVLNAAGKARLNLPKERIRADFGVQPLVTLDSLVSKVPIVGYILTGKDKTLLVYYFKVEGPFSSPEVKYIPLKNWGNSIMGYVTRIFLTPPRLFEKLMKLRKPAKNESRPPGPADQEKVGEGSSK
ncbi:MAG: AsmA-like C-terminal region-containing protein [Deltaproteobacteria bacterium]|nr:AsmA-like C-terminal region-containing protein [Deltaproteobacteria bacterium]